MKRLYFKSKYYWHVLQFKQLKGNMNHSLDESAKSNLEQKMSYHEKSALNYMMKCY